MDCGYFEQLMDRMLDGELSRRESTELHLHLRQCSRCRSLYAALRSVRDSLQEDLAEAPEDLLPNVMEAVYAAAPKRKKRRPWAGWVVTAACAALVIGLGYPVFAPKGAGSAEAESMAFSMADEAAPMAPAARAMPEEAPAEAAPTEAAPAATAEPAEAEMSAYGIGTELPTGLGADIDAGLMTAEAAIEENAAKDIPTEALPLAEEAAPMSLDGQASIACPVYDRFGAYLGEIHDVDSLLGLCVPGGEPLALTDFEADYNIEHDGLVYQFLVQDGQLFWRNDGESLLLPCAAGEDVLLGLIY